MGALCTWPGQRRTTARVGGRHETDSEAWARPGWRRVRNISYLITGKESSQQTRNADLSCQHLRGFSPGTPLLRYSFPWGRDITWKPRPAYQGSSKKQSVRNTARTAATKSSFPSKRGFRGAKRPALRVRRRAECSLSHRIVDEPRASFLSLSPPRNWPATRRQGRWRWLTRAPIKQKATLVNVYCMSGGDTLWMSCASRSDISDGRSTDRNGERRGPRGVFPAHA